MKTVLEGATLSGGYSKVSITQSDRFQFFVHEDSRPPVLVPLAIHNLSVSNHLVTFGSAPCVHGVEHLFSALYGLNLFNVRVDVFGNELPFFDGSSKQFVSVLKEEHYETSNGLKPDRMYEVHDDQGHIIFHPSKTSMLTIDMELSHPYISSQIMSLDITPQNYVEELASARTFVFTNEDDPRLKCLPPYGIGITKENIYSVESLRFRNEFVRHKMLDLLGDLYVSSKRLIGKITCKNTSHQLNLKFVNQVLSTLENN